MTWQTWAPFQSSEIREICAHMTAGERADGVMRGAIYGIWCAVTVAVPFALASVGFIVYGGSFPTSLYVLAGGLIVIHVVLFPRWRRSQLRFLKSTKWAREQRLDSKAAA